MKTKILTSVIIVTALATGALAYADSQTGTGITSKIGSGIFGKFEGHKGFPGMEGPRPGGERGPGMGFPGMEGPRPQLTEAEKTSLEAMTEAEKIAFIKTKMEAEKAKREAKENIIDKLINGESLSDSEKVTLEEIKVERIAQKAEKVKMEAAMTEAKPLLEKLRSGHTLTTDEKTKLDSLKIPGMERGPGMGKGGKGRR